MATLVDWLARAATSDDTGLRILDRRETETWLSWSQIGLRARRVADRLQALGIEPGDRIGLLFPTSAGFVDAFFGTLLAGAVPVPLYPPVRLGRLEEYHAVTSRALAAVEARLVLCARRVRSLLGESIVRARPPLGCLTLEELPRAATGREVQVAEDDLGLIQFSSGTTVDPKPVALSHRALTAQTLALNSFWPEAADMRHSGVSWLPLYHDMGLVGCIFPALERPGTLTLIPPELFVARPAAWLRAISRHRATISPAPNFAYGLCVEKIDDVELEGVELGSWRVALNGAEAVAPSVLRAFIDRFAPFGFNAAALTPVYGLSEASLAVTFADLALPFTSHRFSRESLGGGRRVELERDGLELASVGKPLPGFAIQVRDEDGTPLDEDRIGRLWVKGPSLMDGYYLRPEKTAEVLVDGWLDTGDLGFVHAGELYLTGRAKDLIIHRGRNYPPEQVEQLVDGQPGVRTGCLAAVAYADESLGRERILLFVETAGDATPQQIDELPSLLSDRVFAGCGLEVDEVHLLEPGTLARTSSGKISRSRSLSRFLAGELTAPSRVGFLGLATEMLRSRAALSRSKRPAETADETTSGRPEL